ncbi:MAG: GNAT family N-acetyltransferase [bacterium]|nr:GNAT family N-acetyltransferase [bacterium]
MNHPTIETDRLLLREWRDTDRDGFARMNADPEVMRYFPAPLNREQSDALFDRAVAHFARHGFGMWAVALRSQSSATDTDDESAHSPGAVIGFTGLNLADFEAKFTPAMEIGWRLAREFQGRGYATEAARAVLSFAFEKLELPEIVSFTAVENTASRRVMEKIGMTRSAAEDFEHPALAPGHPLRSHVLYRARRS